MYFHITDVFQQQEHAVGCIGKQMNIFSYTSCIRNHCSLLESSHFPSQRRSLPPAAAEASLSCSPGLRLKPIADDLFRGGTALLPYYNIIKFQHDSTFLQLHSVIREDN